MPEPTIDSRLPDRNPPLRVEVAYEHQGLVYFPGDGMALWLDDRGVDPREYLDGVQLAVLAARLRAFAALCDPSEPVRRAAS